MLAMAHLVDCSRWLNGHGDYICNYNVKAGNATPLRKPTLYPSRGKNGVLLFGIFKILNIFS
jgi:hypothetical protein